MRLDDLKQAMDTIALDVEPVHRQEYQQAVDGRVRARRRYRAVAAGALGAAAVLAAAVVAPTVMDDASPTPPSDKDNGVVDKSDGDLGGDGEGCGLLHSAGRRQAGRARGVRPRTAVYHVQRDADDAQPCLVG
jgi:hypothetical protein